MNSKFKFAFLSGIFSIIFVIIIRFLTEGTNSFFGYPLAFFIGFFVYLFLNKILKKKKDVMGD